MKTYLVMVDEKYADARIYDVDDKGNTTEANESFDTEILLKKIQARSAHEAMKSVAHSENLPMSYLKAYEVAPEMIEYKKPEPPVKSSAPTVDNIQDFMHEVDLIPRKGSKGLNSNNYILTRDETNYILDRQDAYIYSIVVDNDEWKVVRFFVGGTNVIGHLLSKKLVNLKDDYVLW